MDQFRRVDVAVKTLVGVVAVVIALLTLVIGDTGNWNSRLALFLTAAIPGVILLDQVRQAFRE